MHGENTNSISAEKFVDRLMVEGSKINCDETNGEFDRKNQLPSFYNDNLFKRGQKFFYKHIFAMFASKMYGLLAILAIPSILHILKFTKMSGNELTAYKRYLATIFHMMIWYDEDFTPGSKSWKSIGDVKNMHNSASKKSCKAGFTGITQKDMALTQFGFMGLAVVRSEKVGIHGATDEELKAFIHLWRVVGYLMGIEDRFNICNGTVEETKQICNVLISNVFKSEIEKKDRDFLTMCKYICNGLWTMDPFLQYESFMCIIYNLFQDDNNNSSETIYLDMKPVQKFNFYLVKWVFYSLKFKSFRVFYNYSRILSLWLMKVFPFLAYYKFGVKDSVVKL